MNKIGAIFVIPLLLAFSFSINVCAGELLIENEAFSDKGGWVVDQQFIHIMGSSYLLAHGMGEPVADAQTTVTLQAAGDYKVWVRTMDWVPEHTDTPGRFQVKLNGTALPTTFGTNNGWDWIDAGTHSLTGTSLTVTLHDLSGFEGRCDAIYLNTDPNATPPNELDEMTRWRRGLLGLPEIPELAGTFDVVVIGGGMAGTAAAIAAARGGCKVAFIQDRPVLGGNASSDVRVHTLGQKGFRIVDEIDGPVNSNVEAEAVTASQNRLQKVQAESNITLFLSMRAYAVQKQGNKIVSVDAKHIETSVEKRFAGSFFIDCTGDGWIGYWAGARFMMGREAKSEFNESLAPDTRDSLMMGSTILFRAEDQSNNVTFPAVPWAMDVAKDRAATQGHWYYEYGLGMDPFPNAEHIRDHLFRASYGMFYNAKQNSANTKKKLVWVAYIMGKRESRRIVGAHILKEDEIRKSVNFHDGVAFEQRPIDLHIPKPGHPNDFITDAIYTGIPRFTIPFRSLYSADINNLMMAGRCLSVTHVGLGSPRVMNTVGQMGVAVGYAAALCKKYGTDPKGIYKDHIVELQDSIAFPRNTVLPEHVIIMDNKDAQGVQITGDWVSSTSNPRHNEDYIHDDNKGKGQKRVAFSPPLPADGKYTMYIKHVTGGNRATNVTVEINSADGIKQVEINQKQNAWRWVELGTYMCSVGGATSITVLNDNTNGHVVVDAVALVAETPTGNIDDLQQCISNLGSAIHLVNTLGKSVQVKCILGEPGKIDLNIFNVQGKKIATLAKGSYARGIYTFNWTKDKVKVPAGTYIIRLVTDSGTSVKKFQWR